MALMEFIDKCVHVWIECVYLCENVCVEILECVERLLRIVIEKQLANEAAVT